HNVQQVMICPSLNSRIRKVGKLLNQPCYACFTDHHPPPQMPKVDAISGQFTSPCHNSLIVNEFSCSSPELQGRAVFGSQGSRLAEEPA
ncbi:hypothetical protein, partial [Dechloromonas sp.]|uniref:hypothetical protein n=1 Tax=Dechloromonas sp. TaxID=1917218 RepID=UPI00263F844C